MVVINPRAAVDPSSVASISIPENSHYIRVELKTGTIYWAEPDLGESLYRRMDRLIAEINTALKEN